MSQSLIYWHWPFCCMLKKVWGLCLVRAYLHRKRVRREMLGSKWPLGPILNQWLMGGSWCIGILPQLGIQPSLSFQMSQQFSSVPFSCSVVPNSLWPCGLQHTRPPCPSPTPWACSNSYPSSQWCHPTISSSVIPFSFCLQSFPASGSFPMSQLFASGGQSIGVSASTSVLPMNIQDWIFRIFQWISFRMDWLDLLAVQGTLKIFSNTTVEKHQFFSAQLSL